MAEHLLSTGSSIICWKFLKGINLHSLRVDDYHQINHPSLLLKRPSVRTKALCVENNNLSKHAQQEGEKMECSMRHAHYAIMSFNKF